MRLPLIVDCWPLIVPHSFVHPRADVLQSLQISARPEKERPSVRFVIIGHLTRDIVPGGYTIGGTAAYSGITAHRMGAEVTLLTRACPDDVQHPSLRDLEIINLPSKHTTTFLNVYHNDIRTQHVRVVAGPIFAADVPQRLYEADVVHLAPLVQEVDPAIAPKVEGMLASTPQGWMREWDSQGRVKAVPWYSAGRILPYLDTIIFSDADLIGDLSILPTILETVPIVATTKAAAGCVLYVEGTRYKIPTRPAEEVDPTGAGDTFAAAFLVALHETKDPIQAAYFANVTASMGVEARGIHGIPERSQVEAYIEAHPLPPL